MARQKETGLAAVVLSGRVERPPALSLAKHLAPSHLALERLESQVREIALYVEELETHRRVLEAEVVEYRKVVRLQPVPVIVVHLSHGCSLLEWSR